MTEWQLDCALSKLFKCFPPKEIMKRYGSLEAFLDDFLDEDNIGEFKTHMKNKRADDCIDKVLDKAFKSRGYERKEE